VKRVGRLWDEIVAFENLHAAARAALRGKRSRVDAARFFHRLEPELLALRAELAAGSYRPGPYRTFWIRDPKHRMISAAPFRDRVVHHALVRVVEPHFDRGFIHHSYACRMGRGHHRALRQFVIWGRQSRYVLKLDIEKFFPSIDHALLLDRIARRLKDARVLALCRAIVEGSNPQEPVLRYFPGDDLLTPIERARGLPIGNLTSQLFANVFLDSLDHFVKERLGVRRYLRYADDFCCFGDRKDELRAQRAAIVEHLAGLRLTLNEGKSRIRRLREGVEFLGFVVRPSGLRLRAESVRRGRRRIRRLRAAYAGGKIDWPEIAGRLRSWDAHLACGDTWGLRRRVYASSTFVRLRVPGSVESATGHASPPTAAGSSRSSPAARPRPGGSGVRPAPGRARLPRARSSRGSSRSCACGRWRRPPPRSG